MTNTVHTRRVRWPRRAMVAIGVAVAVVAVPMVAFGAFTDVPGSNPFAADINALAGAGITSGCTPDKLNFCPTANITRQAEAAFIHRAMPRVAQWEQDFGPSQIPVSTGVGFVQIQNIMINVPGVPGSVPSQGGNASQFVKVDASVTVVPTSCTGERQMRLRLRDPGGETGPILDHTAYPCATSSLSISHVFIAAPGDRTYWVDAESISSGVGVVVTKVRLYAMSAPFGNQGDRSLGG